MKTIAIILAFTELVFMPLAQARPWAKCVDQNRQIEILMKPDYLEGAVRGNAIDQLYFNMGIPGISSGPNSTMSSFKVVTHRVTSNSIIMSLQANTWPQWGASQGDTFPMGAHFIFTLSRNYSSGVLLAMKDNKAIRKYSLSCHWL